jgi:hypothetical protein
MDTNNPRYYSDLDALSNSIKTGVQQGEDKTRDYLQYIIPIKENAAGTKQHADGIFEDYLIPNLVLGILRVHKIPGFLSAGLSEYNANQEYERGLYFSSSKDFALAEKEYSDWKQIGWLGVISDILFWVIITIFLVLIIAYRQGFFNSR